MGKKKPKKNKNIDEGSKTISLRICVLQILLEDYLKDPSGNSLRLQRLSDENYYSNEINTCLPPKWKFADNVYDGEERFTTSHVKTLYTCTYSLVYESSYYAKYIRFTFSLYHSSVRDNYVAFEVCRWSRIHSSLLKYMLNIGNE